MFTWRTRRRLRRSLLCELVRLQLLLSELVAAAPASHHLVRRQVGPSGFNYDIVPDAYCTNDETDAVKKYEPYQFDAQQCRRYCDANERCVGFEMGCGSQCILLSHCNKTVLSSCHNYIEVQDKQDENLKQSFTRSRVDTRPMLLVTCGCSGSALAVAVLFFFVWNIMIYPKGHGGLAATNGEESEIGLTDEANPAFELSVPYEPITPVHEVPFDPRTRLPSKETDRAAIARSAEYSKYSVLLLGEDVLHMYWQTAKLLGAVGLLIMLASLVTLTGFPADQEGHPRGICGLVRENSEPFSIWDFLTFSSDRLMLINETLYQPPAIEALPMSCAQVLFEDVVKDETGPDCHKWCMHVAGKWPRPWCDWLLVRFGIVYKVCDKVQVWNALKFLPQCTGLTLAVLYGIASVSKGWWKVQSVKQQADEQTDWEGCVPPSGGRGREGPDGELHISPFGQCWPPPFCCFPAGSDQMIARMQLIFMGLGCVLDPAGDFNGWVTFLLNGEIVYGSILFLAAWIPNLHDPLQSDGTSALILSFRRGFPIKDLYRVQLREGRSEGVWSLIIAMYAAIRSSYYRCSTNARATAVDLHMTLSVLYVAFSSMVFAIPHAGLARELLMFNSHLNFNNFYDIAHARNKIGLRKFLPALDALALAVAFGRTFSSSMMIIQLWFIGAFSGFFGWLLFQLYRSPKRGRCCPKRLWTFFQVFVFWPLSPTKLTGHCKLWVAMNEGVAATSEIVCLGYSSLPPVAYYSHRILTLTAFWVFTFIRDDRYFYHLIFAKDTTGTPVSSISLWTGHYCITSLLVLGWLALVLEAVLFLLNRQDMTQLFNDECVRLMDLYHAGDEKLLLTFG